jgi:hypothetical protein
MKGIRRAFWTLLAVSFTVTVLWLTSRSVTPKQATWEDVLTEARKGGYRLVTVDELWERYQKDPNDLLLVDTRQEWEYRTGHIKGSLNFPMEPTWLSRWRKKDALHKFLGPDKNRLIVFY